MKKLLAILFFFLIPTIVFSGGLVQLSDRSDDASIKAIIKTVEAGNLTALWQKGGEDTTSRGDRVVWGYFYADPNDVAWGSINNPEVFVKVWYDAEGRVDVNFFHVSVPDIEVFATYNGVHLNATANMSKRYIRHYYSDNNVDGTSENTEDGVPVSGYSQANSPVSYLTINNLNIGAMINTVEAIGSIDAHWVLGGQDTTFRGDQVVWGHFYADPNDVNWGSKNNPELFVKIWFDVSGRIDVNYFHVSVPDIEVYSDYGSDGIYDTKGTTIMIDRYIRHEYQSSSDGVKGDGISREEKILFDSLNQYRKENGLDAIPASKALSTVGNQHILDLLTFWKYGETLHGWSDAPYPPYSSMYEAPQRLDTNYPGDGYEISMWDSRGITAEKAISGWKGSMAHNQVILNQGVWSAVTWKALGVAIDGNFVAVWFGKETDSTGEPPYE